MQKVTYTRCLNRSRLLDITDPSVSFHSTTALDDIVMLTSAITTTTVDLVSGCLGNRVRSIGRLTIIPPGIFQHEEARVQSCYNKRKGQRHAYDRDGDVGWATSVRVDEVGFDAWRRLAGWHASEIDPRGDFTKTSHGVRMCDYLVL
jgi:hypothetical protein